GERVILWLQNSHAAPIPAGAIGLNPMGDERVITLDEPIGPFATRAVDVAELLPGIVWPRQIELRAGKHMVRPRYEIVEGRRRRCSTTSRARLATAMGMSSWSMISRRAARATAGCTRCSAIVTAKAAISPKPALARMSLTRSLLIATSRNPMVAARRGYRPG